MQAGELKKCYILRTIQLWELVYSSGSEAWRFEAELANDVMPEQALTLALELPRPTGIQNSSGNLVRGFAWISDAYHGFDSCMKTRDQFA